MIFKVVKFDHFFYLKIVVDLRNLFTQCSYNKYKPINIKTMTLKNLIQYRYSVELLMFAFLKNQVDVLEFTQLLNDIEDKHREEVLEGNPNINLWFRFGDDTIIYTIQDLKNDLELPHNHINRLRLLENFRMAIELMSNVELMIYFS